MNCSQSPEATVNRPQRTSLSSRPSRSTSLQECRRDRERRICIGEEAARLRIQSGIAGMPNVTTPAKPAGPPPPRPPARQQQQQLQQRNWEQQQRNKVATPVYENAANPRS